MCRCTKGIRTHFCGSNACYKGLSKYEWLREYSKNLTNHMLMDRIAKVVDKVGLKMKKITYTDGTKAWYKNGELHRDNKPAIKFTDGTQIWYKNGKLHREDGPAVEDDNGMEEYWIDGEQMTEDEFFADSILDC